MAESYLTLLQEGNRVTADAMDRISKNANAHMQLQQQQSQFESEMIMKGAQFAQSERESQAQIQHTKNADYMAVQEFNRRQEIAPLERETANLKLEAQKFQYAYEKQKVDNASFNSITDIHDEQMGSIFLRSQNINQIQDYQNLKIKYKSDVAQGLPFNNAEFDREKKGLIEKYSDEPLNEKPWSAETRYALDSVNPKLGPSYDMLNPRNKVQKNSLSTAFLSMDDKEEAEFINRYSGSGLFSDEEIGNMYASKTSFKHNSLRSTKAYDEINKLQLKLTSVFQKENPTAYKDTQEQISLLKTEASSSLISSQKIQQNFSKGDFLPIYELDPSGSFGKSVGKTPEQLFAEKAERIKKLAGARKESSKEKSAGGVKYYDDEEGLQINSRLSVVTNLFTGENKDSLDSTEMQGLDFDWFGENRPQDIADDVTMNRIKSQVDKNIESMEEGGVKFNTRFTSERVNGLFQGLDKDINVPISPFTFEAIGKEWGLKPVSAKQDAGFYETGSKERNYQVTFGPKSKIPLIGGQLDKQKITSYQDILNLTKSITSIAERELINQELYASLIAAASTNAVQAK